MITIEQRPAQLLKNKQSLFVSLPYSLDNVSKIKSLPKRAYVPATKEWEVPVGEINTILTMFQSEQIKMKGKATTKVKVAVENKVTFDTIDTNGFNFKTTPFDHQIEGFNYGVAHNKFLLGDEQGLGKTKQSIDIAIARKSQFKHTLIVCGVNGLKWNWLAEIGVHSHEKGHIIGSKVNTKGKTVIGSSSYKLEELRLIDKGTSPHSKDYFLITNIETLRDKAICEKLSDMCKNGVIGMVIVDEIHKAKNPTSQQGKAIQQLNSFYKIALTGTPLMNQPLDLYNILKWLDVEHHSFYGFKQRYCVLGGFGGYEVVGYKNLNELRGLLENNMLRRKKEDVLDLPPKIRSTEYVEMTPKQATIYKEVMNAIKSDVDQIKLSANPLAQLIRLRQATGYTGILSSSIHESAKLDRMEELVAEYVDNGEKVIIFSNWTDMTHVVESRLKQYNPAVITGETTNRQEEVDRFQTDGTCKVIIGTIGAMGTGLTLTKATKVIFLDSPWNRANKEQAEDRAHRIGTTGTVNIITLVCKDTIDERIEEIVESKGDMADALVDGKLDKLNKNKLVDYLLS